tara:strand:+ start:124 stop:279 length:156 start_codon:yes stop_codon:yes gene_type:complete
MDFPHPKPHKNAVFYGDFLKIFSFAFSMAATNEGQNVFGMGLIELFLTLKT